ncbi:MAG TPA: DUF1579 family protein [Vicinamibacteria bacterium]|nr:DUF1579 family protein [Vicinamibacteria bacterium]
MTHPRCGPTVRPSGTKAFLVSLSLALTAAASRPAVAGAPPPAPPKAPPAATAPSTDEEILRYLSLSRPGPEHRWLDPLVGSWTVELRWPGVGQTEAHASGTSENRWILDGRFLLCESTAGDGPSRLGGTTIYGFDSREKKYFALGLNNLATYYLQPSGSYDPVTRSFLLSGKERDEATGGSFVYRELLKIDGDDRHVLKVYLDVLGRPPVKVLEAVFTRR